ncbi:LysR family transcriptional regulator [Segnochrobactrum spirostomi]|nr:LysR family transcriptional regulator [Segnochrobactrum spirostomi]
MDLRLLNSFVMTAELGNMTAAAAKLHITQSTLSRQIKALEDDLGVGLFDRAGRKLRLSKAGEALIAKAHDLVAAGQGLRAYVDGIRVGDAGVLRVGACSQLIERYFPAFLAEWRLANPTVEIRLHEAGGAELDTMLGEGELHLVVNAQARNGDSGLDFVRLGRLTTLAVGAHPLLDPSPHPVEASEVSAHPLLILNRRHASREMFDAACRLAGLKPVIGLESSSPHTLFSLAEAGLGIAVVPSSARVRRPGLAVRPLAFNGRLLDFEVSATWSRRNPLPDFGRRFVEALGAHIRAEEDGDRAAARPTLLRSVGG